jgi:spore germination protein GerM
VKKLIALSGLVLLGCLGFVLAGCGSGGAVSLGSPPTGSTSGPEVTETGSTTQAKPTTVRTPLSFEVWFARGERLIPQLRTHAPTRLVATAAVSALLAGPTPAERTAGIATAVPAGTRLLGISINQGVATVDLTSGYQSGGGSLSMQLRLAQVVYTLTQFPTVKTVRFALDGAPVNVFSGEGIVLDHPAGRSDYADLAPPPLAGTWRHLPQAPLTLDLGSATSVWTGRQMIVFGTHKGMNVAAAYDPTAGTWRRLPSGGKAGTFPPYRSVWTGKEMLVWGQGTREAFNPATNRWRRLPSSPLLAIHEGHGLVVWTGREMIGWGGGCCGDAFSDGVAYSPATNKWHALAQAPLAGSQHPIGAWTGKELIVLVGNLNPLNGKPWPARLARAAAYNPATDTWRRIASIPAPRDGANAVWDGRELLVVGGGAVGGKQLPPVGFAYNPATNRWRRLSPMESGRSGSAAVWTGKELLLWGGGTGRAGSLVIPPHGLAYEPATNRWSSLPQAPLKGRLDPTAVWTGRSMIVWGGSPNGPGPALADGAAFTPATP